MEKYGAIRAKVEQLVLDGPGTLSASVRKGCAANAGLPPVLAAFIEKVHTRAFAMTDDDVRDVLNAGYSEDQIFEAVVSAALGASRSRYEHALEMMKGGAR